MSTHAELSSIATLVQDVSDRLTALANGLEGPEREALVDDLFEVERILGTARRRLDKIVSDARRVQR